MDDRLPAPSATVRDADDKVDSTLVRHHIAPNQRVSRQDLRELWASRDLFTLLLAREIRVRYKQTTLGVVWVVLQPLVPALIFAVVFGALVGSRVSTMPYLLLAMSGLVLYSLFTSTLGAAGSSFLKESALLSKVYFPRAILPAAAGAAPLVDFLVGAVLLLIIAVFLGLPPTVTFLAMPLVVAMTFALGLSIGMGVGALSAYRRDFMLAIPSVLRILLYASPILYPLELVPGWLRPVYALNPFVGLLELFRWSFFGTAFPDVLYLVEGAIVGSIMIIISLAVFFRLERNMSDVL